MWGSLDVLDVGFFLVCDSAVLEFLGGDLVSSIADLAGALPVPVKASHILESCHFFVGQVGDNLKHILINFFIPILKYKLYQHNQINTPCG